MIYTIDQMKRLSELGLEDEGEYRFKLVRFNQSENEKKELISMDEEWMEINGEHLVSNIELLK